MDFDSDLDGLLGNFDDSSIEDFCSANGDEEAPLVLRLKFEDYEHELN